MSAAVYVHTPTGDQYHQIGVLPVLGFVVLCPVDCHEDAERTEFWILPGAAFAEFFVKVDDILDVARAFGVLVEVERQPGEQPQVEFSAGPIGPGPMWTDEYLAQVFGLDEAAGGGA